MESAHAWLQVKRCRGPSQASCRARRPALFLLLACPHAWPEWQALQVRPGRLYGPAPDSLLYLALECGGATEARRSGRLKRRGRYSDSLGGPELAERRVQNEILAAWLTLCNGYGSNLQRIRLAALCMTVSISSSSHAANRRCASSFPIDVTRRPNPRHGRHGRSISPAY